MGYVKDIVAQDTRRAEAAYNPYITDARAAQGQYMAQMGLSDAPAFDITQLPGYQQSLQQGIGAVNQGAAGAGMLMSGERLKSLQQAGQSVFGDYYNNYMNRLQGLTGQGLQATNSLQAIRNQNLNSLIGYKSSQNALKAGGRGGSGLAGDALGATASIVGSLWGSS